MARRVSSARNGGTLAARERNRNLLRAARRADAAAAKVAAAEAAAYLRDLDPRERRVDPILSDGRRGHVEILAEARAAKEEAVRRFGPDALTVAQ